MFKFNAIRHSADGPCCVWLPLKSRQSQILALDRLSYNRLVRKHAIPLCIGKDTDDRRTAREG